MDKLSMICSAHPFTSDVNTIVYYCGLLVEKSVLQKCSKLPVLLLEEVKIAVVCVAHPLSSATICCPIPHPFVLLPFALLVFLRSPFVLLGTLCLLPPFIVCLSPIPCHFPWLGPFHLFPFQSLLGSFWVAPLSTIVRSRCLSSFCLDLVDGR